MKLIKYIAVLCVILSHSSNSFAFSLYGDSNKLAPSNVVGVESSGQEVTDKELVEKFVPDVHIKEQTKEDLELLAKMKPLFCEHGNDENSWRKIYETVVSEYGAQEIMLHTNDYVRVSALYYKRPHAKLNLILVPGYFHDETPPKEWCAPFAEIFPDYNILAFDWRGIGNSEGENYFLEKNSFGSNAYKDIQAALEFVRRDNKFPIMLHGFCLGAAMVLHATLQAKKEGKMTADGLGVSCIFPDFKGLFERAVLVEDRWYFRLVLQTGIGEGILNYMMDGSLFDIRPVDFIKEIDIPCYFDHYAGDPFSQIAGGIKVYNAKQNGFKWFVKGDLGRHVRIHGKTPFQYRLAFNEFLTRSGLLPDEKK